MSGKKVLLRYLLVSIGSIALAFIVFCVSYVVYLFFYGRVIQSARSPKKDQVAVLRRHFGVIDYNLSVNVGGLQIYRSGDIFGISPEELRAVLIWDKTGRIIAYEELSKIKFAYDVVDGRRIGMDELEKYCLSPMPEEYEQKQKAVCGEE